MFWLMMGQGWFILFITVNVKDYHDHHHDHDNPDDDNDW